MSANTIHVCTVFMSVTLLSEKRNTMDFFFFSFTRSMFVQVQEQIAGSPRPTALGCAEHIPAAEPRPWRGWRGAAPPAPSLTGESCAKGV